MSETEKRFVRINGGLQSPLTLRVTPEIITLSIHDLLSVVANNFANDPAKAQVIRSLAERSVTNKQTPISTSSKISDVSYELFQTKNGPALIADLFFNQSHAGGIE